MSVKNPCIQKYVKRKAKASMCRKPLFSFLFYFLPGICLKLETVHKLIESKKMEYTGNKFLQSGLQGNKDNKSLIHATLCHAVHYATLQNIELTIYQETIQLA